MSVKKRLKINRHFKPILDSSYFLFGPRGSGKSSFLTSHYGAAFRINLLDEVTFIKYTNHPNDLKNKVAALDKDSTIIIDEVQRVPQLLNVVHELMETSKYKKMQFILTGSSARKLKSQGVNLLAGRALLKKMFPFTVSELGSSFSVDKALKTGLIPLIYFSKTPKETLESYLALYLKEEVKQEGLVRNLESFTRFLEVMCFSHAEILNLSNVSREASIKRTTVDGYLSILEDLLLGYRIQSFKIKNRKHTVESEKFYYFDIGVFNALCPKGFLEDKHQFKGQSVEGLVAQNLVAWCHYQNNDAKVYFWRTQAGSEVDFIIYGPKIFWAIEVKASNSIKSEFLGGLKSFHQDYPSSRKIILYMGDEKQKIEEIEVWNIFDFLKTLKVI